MADYLTTDTELAAVADAIRTKGGTSAQLEFPTGFVSAIAAIPSGGGGGTTSVTIYPSESGMSYSIGYVDANGDAVTTGYAQLDPTFSGSATLTATSKSPLTFFYVDAMDASIPNPTNTTLIFSQSGSVGSRPASKYLVESFWVN